MKLFSYGIAFVLVAAASLATVSDASAKGSSCQPGDKTCCYIGDLPCWGANSKCNIKFKNRTGAAKGSGGTKYEQNSLSLKVAVKAQKQKSNGKWTSVGNVLTIEDRQSNTLNLDKKNDFDRIMISPRNAVSSVSGTSYLGCDQIRQILKAVGSCEVFVGQASLGDRVMRASCDKKAIYSRAQ